MNHTTQFLLDAAARPADAQAITEVSEDVRAELGARGVAIGSFLKFLPQILAVVRILTGEGTPQEKIAAVIEVIFGQLPE
jgi:hypothetical protein